MPPRVPRGHRYWLKENWMDFFFPRLSQEEFKRRCKLWDPSFVAGNVLCFTVGIYGTLRYLWPKTFMADFPIRTFLQYGWENRQMDRAIKRRTNESREY